MGGWPARRSSAPRRGQQERRRGSCPSVRLKNFWFLIPKDRVNISELLLKRSVAIRLHGLLGSSPRLRGSSRAGRLRGSSPRTPPPARRLLRTGGRVLVPALRVPLADGPLLVVVASLVFVCTCCCRRAAMSGRSGKPRRQPKKGCQKEGCEWQMAPNRRKCPQCGTTQPGDAAEACGPPGPAQFLREEKLVRHVD
jgi:hypothetical protein